MAFKEYNGYGHRYLVKNGDDKWYRVNSASIHSAWMHQMSDVIWLKRFDMVANWWIKRNGAKLPFNETVKDEDLMLILLQVEDNV